ncbi:MAG: membrane-bound lytic murein transglycosylase F [Flavobacteriales bacterium]|jgi:membrane-bound lytic murein transglycosylase F
MPETRLHTIAYKLGSALTGASKLGMLCLSFVYLQSSRPPTILEEVLNGGTLRVISRNGPTTYYEGPDGLTGFEYQLTEAFAESLNVALEIVEEEDLAEIIDSVGGKRGHIAAAGLTVTPKRQQKVLFGPSYLEVTQQLIYRAGSPKPTSPIDLIGKKIVVIANSSHAERLRQLRREHRTLEWEEVFDLEMVELLEQVHLGEIDFTIVDSNSYEINNTLYPKARVAFDISPVEQLAWAFPISQDTSLYKLAMKFFEDYTESGKLAHMREIYYGHAGELNYSDSLLFAHRLESRLPKWSDKLKSAAEKHILDWNLLAAISYQESHWNPKAVSRTGVKGFMMLTLPTAKEMGVTNRLDATQSIFGGAKYFKKSHSRIPSRIAEPDRTWFALAAYNQGFGHVEDARKLTQHRGGDPDKWSDVREDLLLLSKRKYYKFTKHGYARGWEAVHYVQNIRNYYSIITWHEKEMMELVAALDEQAEAGYLELSPVVTDAVKTIAGPSDEP